MALIRWLAISRLISMRFIILLIVNSQATSQLRRNGVHIGFIEARKRNLDDLEARRR